VVEVKVKVYVKLMRHFEILLGVDEYSNLTG